MKEKAEKKKSEKEHDSLNFEECEKMLEILKKRGDQKIFAREIGKSETTVSTWASNKRFPRYCVLKLKNVDLMRENKALRELVQELTK
jgi:hypothetical protein